MLRSVPNMHWCMPAWHTRWRTGLPVALIAHAASNENAPFRLNVRIRVEALNTSTGAASLAGELDLRYDSTRSTCFWIARSVLARSKRCLTPLIIAANSEGQALTRRSFSSDSSSLS